MHRTAHIEFTLSLTELKRAFRRLSARLPDESDAGGAFVVFTTCDDKLEITANGTSEGLSLRRSFRMRERAVSRLPGHCENLAVPSSEGDSPCFVSWRADHRSHHVPAQGHLDSSQVRFRTPVSLTCGSFVVAVWLRILPDFA